MPFWREYYIILFDDDHIFVIMYYEKCVVDKMTELPKTLSEYYGYGEPPLKSPSKQKEW